MKKLFTLCMLIALVAISSAQTQQPKPDSILHTITFFKFDVVDGNFLYSEKDNPLSILCGPDDYEVYTYDTNGNIATKDVYPITTGIYTEHIDSPQSHEEWEYDEAGNCTLHILFGSSKYKLTYTYSDGVLTTERRYGWSTSSNDWYYNTLVKYTYTNNLLTKVSEYIPSNNFENRRIHYTYNANNQLTEEWIEQNNGQGWVNAYKYTYEYNDAGLLANYKFYKWNTNAPAKYELDYQIEYAYDGNGNTIQITRYEGRFGWQPHQSQYYTYNENNQVKSYLLSSLDYYKNKWYKEDSTAYYYTENNQLYAAFNYDFDRENNSIKLEKADYYYYKSTSAPYYFLWTIPYEKDPFEEGYATAANVYVSGTTVEIEAIPNEGYVFKQWSDGNTDNPRYVFMDKNYYLQAEFDTAPETGLINLSNSSPEYPTYDILGRKVNADYHGIVIQNGKKHIQ